MPLIKGIQSLSQAFPHSLVTVGNFDGLHLGHQEIIKLAIQEARKIKSPALVFTFRPHPQEVLHPNSPMQLLNSYDEKIELLEKLAVDWIIEEPFTKDFSMIDPEKFFSEILIAKLNPRCIVVGYDFAFGRGRNGDLKLLENFCKKAGVQLQIVQPHRVAGEIVSSRKIRQFLLEGKMQEAKAFLGTEFVYSGDVIKGEGRGKKIGYATLNIELGGKLILPYGVYASLVGIKSKTSSVEYFPSVTNIGIRPTFENDANRNPLLEAHLIDREMSLYGEKVEVKLLQYLRKEMKFKSVDDLKNQIAADIRASKKLLF